jgi:hypothetical protein
MYTIMSLKGAHSMGSRKFHEIWIEQCDAAEEVKLRYGLGAAFDYLVAEKLLNFVDTASRNPEFAIELPRFVARVRDLFTVEEMRMHLNRIESERREYDASIEERDDFDDEDEQEEEERALGLESSTATEERARQFATIAELLTTAELGTS